MGRTPNVGPPVALWDPLVRISHWGIAIVVIANALITRGGSALHVGIGWAALALLILRIGWGLVGVPEARFSAFPPHPRAALAHLRSLLTGTAPPHYRSHNPAGAIMVYSLWGTLALVIATGLMMTTASPLKLAEQEAIVASGDWSTLVTAHQPTEDTDNTYRKLVGGVHNVAANLMLLLAVLHVGGVIVESRAMRRNLVAPMIAGHRGRRE